MLNNSTCRSETAGQLFLRGLFQIPAPQEPQALTTSHWTPNKRSIRNQYIIVSSLRHCSDHQRSRADSQDSGPAIYGMPSSERILHKQLLQQERNHARVLHRPRLLRALRSRWQPDLHQRPVLRFQLDLGTKRHRITEARLYECHVERVYSAFDERLNTADGLFAKSKVRFLSRSVFGLSMQTRQIVPLLKSLTERGVYHTIVSLGPRRLESS